MSKIKVIHIIDSLSMGGLEKIVVDICNALDKTRFQVYLINIFNDKAELFHELSGDITYIELPYSCKKLTGIRSLFHILPIFKSLRKVIKEINPHVVHSHPILHHLLVIVLALRTYKNEIRYFHTIHTSALINSVYARFKLAIDKIIFRIYKPHLIAISEVIQKDNLKFHRQCTSSLIHNGIDLARFSRGQYKSEKSDWKIPMDHHVLVYVARLGPGKNHLTLLKALTLVVNENEKTTLVLAGDGPFKMMLKEFVSQHTLEKNVIFLGSINNVPELLSIADLGVFPSEFEGFGLSLIEMMSMGIPVIAANNEVFESMITSDLNGVIFPVHDFKQLALEIRNLLNDQNKRIHLSSNAIKFSRGYSLQRMISKYEDCYSSSISY